MSKQISTCWSGALLSAFVVITSPAAAEWRATTLATSGRVRFIDVSGDTVRIQIESGWYQIADDGKLANSEPIKRPANPAGGIPDGMVAKSDGKVSRAWLSDPTSRYDHGVLGDAIEAGRLNVDRSDGKGGSIVLDKTAVFEDLAPRIVKIDGKDVILVVKSYLARGSALAVVDPDMMAIRAETPAIGRPHAWLNPAGVADFNGDGITDIALVRQPHVVGQLELWSFVDGILVKNAQVNDVSNHYIGSKSLGMSWTADFNGDGVPDLAIPSLDRKSIRILAFAPQVHEIARLSFGSKLATNFGGVVLNGRIALIVGDIEGKLLLVQKY